MNLRSSLLVIFLLFTTVIAFAQKKIFNKNVNKDSLLNIIYGRLGSEERVKEFKENYDNSNEQVREFMLLIAAMPYSSKKALVANVDTNLLNINTLIKTYSAFVPKEKVVYIEFKPADNILNSLESIDIRIQYKDPDNFNSLTTYQKWELTYGSTDLKDACKILGWNIDTLKKIKLLLDKANCISIENAAVPEVGYARSGMGKYSYLIFPNDLSSEQIKHYNDGCSMIYYKKNIVLGYAGGAIGSQCFPKED